MVTEISRGGLIVAQAAEPSALLDELVALCDWPLLVRPSARALFQHIDACRPACLLFWLETTGEVASAVELVARLRDRGPRPYRIAVAHCLGASVEPTLRTAGVHSYFAVNGGLHSLVDQTLSPFVEAHRAATRPRTPHAPEAPVPIRGPTEVRGSPATMRPP
jgi:hypothetical protein